jgi:endonuclease III-like uncharacterized protein
VESLYIFPIFERTLKFYMPYDRIKHYFYINYRRYSVYLQMFIMQNYHAEIPHHSKEYITFNFCSVYRYLY